MRSAIPWINRAAVALVAAALADPLVESIANSGIVGRGYHDNDHASVVPTLVAGTMLVLLLITARCVRLVNLAPGRRSRLLAVARRISERSPIRDLPYVLSLQFAALFAMESSEQLMLVHRLSGGSAWLGGPVWFSVLTHVAIGVACTVLAARTMRAVVRGCADLVIALEFILCAFGRERALLFARRDNAAAHVYRRILDACRCGERAPPLQTTLV
ncbi:MAG TPA: hypothetical protein VMA98_03305 [Candidatus Acidoferrales bacterium]|nr:hypothetical protein [Candidatus Acidoferrales bacterium]